MKGHIFAISYKWQAYVRVWIISKPCTGTQRRVVLGVISYRLFDHTDYGYTHTTSHWLNHDKTEAAHISQRPSRWCQHTHHTLCMVIFKKMRNFMGFFRLKERTTSQSINYMYQTSRKCKSMRSVLMTHQRQSSPIQAICLHIFTLHRFWV